MNQYYLKNVQIYKLNYILDIIGYIIYSVNGKKCIW